MREIKTRADMALLLLDLVRPLRARYSEGGALLTLGSSAASYGQRTARMEAWSRVLWGLGPLFAGGRSDLPGEAVRETKEWEDLVRRGLINGTDPAHEEYWGDVRDHDQMMVEMAAIANAVILCPEVFWEPLTGAQRKNLYQWLNGINAHEMGANNWRFFRILVNALFRKLGLPWDENRMKEDFGVIEHCYEGDGWYFDGRPEQKDYYIPFAMHYYGLIYAERMQEEEPERCGELRERAKLFYEDFKYWFDGDGREVPFGRSLTYRFAHGAVFAAMARAGVDVPLGELKHLMLDNLRYWMEKPIFDCGGILSVGYQYPNLFMSERYNAPGSPYWALKTFLALSLPQEHPFWQAQERRPETESLKLLAHPNMIAVHEKSGHTLLYPTGQRSPQFGNMVAKYQKFVYSNRFGFSVSRGMTLEEGAFDNTLAVSEKGLGLWRMRDGWEKYEVTEQYTATLYEPIPGVRIESRIYPMKEGHVRVHYVRTEKAVELADGGFAVPAEGDGGQRAEETMIKCDGNSVFCDFPWANAGAVSLDGTGTAQIVTPFPNTGLMCGVTKIPTIFHTLEPGEHCIVNWFYGDEGKREMPVKASEFRIPGKLW